MLAIGECVVGGVVTVDRGEAGRGEVGFQDLKEVCL